MLKPYTKPMRSMNFICLAPTAQSVTLVGDFNQWNPHTHSFKQQTDGGWLITVELKHGHHRYAFLVDGMLTLDLPPEEADELLAACAKHDLKTVFIVAPTTPASRLPRIGAAATGFIYYVSREGVTGVRDQVAANIPEAVARIRQHTTLPVAVGFGLSTPEQIKQVARVADGVVVGSALVNVIKENLDNRAGLPARLRIAAAELVAGAA